MFSYVALVSETPRIPNWQVQMVAAALQIQVSRDFTPIWGIDATLSAFDQLGDVPSGFWPIVIRDDIGFAGAAGIHLDQNKKPFGLVQASNRWSLTASHEVLEMLADPMGNRTLSAQSIKPGQGIVEFLVEVCDPSEDEDFTYQINGVIVSDFYTPDFFLPRESGNVRYSFSGGIEKPRNHSSRRLYFMARPGDEPLVAANVVHWPQSEVRRPRRPGYRPHQSPDCDRSGHAGPAKKPKIYLRFAEDQEDYRGSEEAVRDDERIEPGSGSGVGKTDPENQKGGQAIALASTGGSGDPDDGPPTDPHHREASPVAGGPEFEKTRGWILSRARLRDLWCFTVTPLIIFPQDFTNLLRLLGQEII